MPIRARKHTADIFSIDRPGDSRAVSEATGWKTFQAQVESGAIDAVGPKEIAKAFTMNESVMSKGLGHVAANGSKIKNYGEKRIVGHTEARDGASMKVLARGCLEGARVGSQDES